jgi:DNA-binding response OmpR family regulator
VLAVAARVLIVEDDCLIALALGVEAQAFGHHVVGPVATIAAAQDLIDSEILDYALLDYRLADGVADDLVLHLDDAGIPFAWLSGCENRELPSGAQVFLQKPFDLQSLRRMLQALPAGSRRLAS